MTVTARALHGLAGHCRAVAAEHADPELVAAVVAWLVRPRRGLDGLRRACREDGFEGDDARARLLAVASQGLRADDARAAVEVVRVWQRLGVRCATVVDDGYPRQLGEGWPEVAAPAVLAWRGAQPDHAPAVAIVGSRRASGYGTGVAAWLAEAAAGAGIRVVSGGAVGVDAAAHEAAHALPGATTVVLGCGHAIGYPRPHARPGGLFDRIVEAGGTLVSELLPHEPPRAWQVRARNRIVAGLADLVVVVEGGARSGALLTAGAAAELGRAVLAVPGDVRAPGSAAPHRLLAEGAAPCTGPVDLLEAVTGIGAEPPGRDGRGAGGSDAIAAGGDAPQRPVSTLPPAVHAALVGAWPRPLRLDVLAEQSGLAVPAVLAAVTRARVAGEVAEGVDGIRLRRAPR